MNARERLQAAERELDAVFKVVISHKVAPFGGPLWGVSIDVHGALKRVRAALEDFAEHLEKVDVPEAPTR